ncbi:protein of unknown function [Denitratisoma oestradiolicum]|uniref:Uncharacterized protein n=2 Tax=Denitratisoma oestradiolicum TaxID=311182 RepID=A0A6S6XS52_9PROT|nr:protein of unknown function [Denitratisoma oestradiolicum]
MRWMGSLFIGLMLAHPVWGQMGKGMGREFRELGEQIGAASQAGDLDRGMSQKTEI